MTVTTFAIEPRGAFDLRLAAGFGFGPDTDRPAADRPLMRLALLADDLVHHAGIVARQDRADGTVYGEIHGDADADAVTAQIARVLSLDHDGVPFAEAGARDPVLGGLQAAHPGLRPVLFHSPYEAAAWALISHRRPAAQAAATRLELCRDLGASFALDGETMHAFPAPRRLATLAPRDGLPDLKVQRLRALAAAALDGRLDAAHLQAVEPEAALAELQELPGIGPFWAALIVIRATGLADVLPTSEPRLLRAIRERYALDAEPDEATLTALAEPWRPRRTWACVLIRYAAQRA